jgi:hypothetical protein
MVSMLSRTKKKTREVYCSLSRSPPNVTALSVRDTPLNILPSRFSRFTMISQTSRLSLRRVCDGDCNTVIEAGNPISQNTTIQAGGSRGKLPTATVLPPPRPRLAPLRRGVCAANSGKNYEGQRPEQFFRYPPLRGVPRWHQRCPAPNGGGFVPYRQRQLNNYDASFETGTAAWGSGRTRRGSDRRGMRDIEE